MKRLCEHCGVEYKYRGNRERKYCGRKCSGEAHSTKVERECEFCGEKFLTWPAYIAKDGGKYCDRECRDKDKITKVERNCEICGKPVYVKFVFANDGKRKYCSRKCVGIGRTKYYTGENSTHWKGGVTPEQLLDRRGLKYQNWREAIFSRDNWTCQDCGERGGTLHAHHVFAFADFPEHRFAPWNGVTLCKDCHLKTHSKQVAV